MHQFTSKLSAANLLCVTHARFPWTLNDGLAYTNDKPIADLNRAEVSTLPFFSLIKNNKTLLLRVWAGMSLNPVSEHKQLDNNVLSATYGISLDFSFSYFISMIQKCLKGIKP